MAFTKITDADLQGKGVVGQAPVPGLPVKEMQESVEQIVREVAIPGINRLADELSAQTAAKNIGMQVPDGMPGGASANVSSVVGTHVLSTGNPHKVTAEQVGAYTKEQTDQAINQKVQDIGAGDMSKSEYARTGTYGAVDRALSADRAVQSDDGVKVYTHAKSGTVHAFTGAGANGRALMTANVSAGDTFTVNGQAVTAYMGAERAVDAMAGSAWSGKWVSFIVEGDTLNFKGGGGKVTVTGLSADVVKKGTTVTVKQGDKTVASVLGTLAPASDPVQMYSNVLGAWQRPTMSYEFAKAATSCIIFTSCAGYTGESPLDGNQTVTLSGGTLTELYSGYSSFYVGLRIKIFLAKNVPKGAVVQLRSNHKGTEGQSLAVYKVY